ncbi:hypothetical protein JHK82_055388 [Glycine max]|nr:hypothetical protein JHK86_055225 [Glycine max]KAG5074020.1 hypothetical protein JHK84_055251 [Glycine max]KAG5076693.1 hypothetical protein JHK82_055388 [Glycine max]
MGDCLHELGMEDLKLLEEEMDKAAKVVRERKIVFTPGQDKCFLCGLMGHMAANCEGKAKRKTQTLISRIDELHGKQLPRLVGLTKGLEMILQAPNLQHPLVCIDVIEARIVVGPRVGLWKEVEAFEGLVRSDTCKSLVHIFFAQRVTSKTPRVTDRGLVPRQVKKVAIIGGGLLGSGVATALILSNYHVILKEVNEKFLDAGMNRIKDENR